MPESIWQSQKAYSGAKNPTAEPKGETTELKKYKFKNP
jgi:hypothetical protein